jgi:hypothetical protein
MPGSFTGTTHRRFTHTASLVAERINLGRFSRASKEGGYEAVRTLLQEPKRKSLPSSSTRHLTPTPRAIQRKGVVLVLTQQGAPLSLKASAKRQFGSDSRRGCRVDKTTRPWFVTKATTTRAAQRPVELYLHGLETRAGSLLSPSIHRPHAMPARFGH